ncbi:transglycosylase domain-containing protein [Pedomonas mirosovicensis]|uniref:transglycosylase domain-containing protein n=1 Tax=Pedomonas mirosovicensis TaxID=2908641 RepID=UPI0021698324|nr:PBP1A family penicillin-binding protein [Pedomonas mirosovicensis]MCH8684073.1 PBP1A family penicillin-binding protein [Pedomonas mirosovicensis]
MALACGVALLVALGVGAAIGLAIQSLPSFEELKTQPRGQMIVIKGMDGSTLVTIGPSYGEWLSSRQLPDTIKTAMVDIEDRKFYRHFGIDPEGIARALVRNIQAGRHVQGGSTITQQVAKNLFLTNERSYTRKLREMILALALESQFTKDQILELYLNRVYFGGGAYGVDAASRKFFGHSARTLSLPEASIIAGLVKAPTRYAPSSDPEKAKDRAAIVLAAMVATGDVSPAEAKRIDFDQVRFARQPRENNVRYFTDWVLEQLDSITDEAVQPLEIETTLDPKAQRAAEQAIAANTPEGVQGALVALAHDGAVRAMVGGRDYVSSTYNRATVARRQPGSSFKLFVYLAALENGAKPQDVYMDEPITINGWSPSNYTRTFKGPMTVEQAFAQSINTIAVRIADEVGFERVASMARRFGITTPVATTPAMALGASEVRVIDMTAAYAAVARGGVEVRPYGIRLVKTMKGKVLYRYQPDAPRELVSPEVAADITRLLQAAVQTGTAHRADIGRPAAGKTGTTQSNRDGWFLGFTADLTAGVWMGRDDSKAVRGLAGGAAPTRAWAAFMSEATKGLPVQPLFVDASGVDGAEPDDEAYGLIEGDLAAAPGEEGSLLPDGTPVPMPGEVAEVPLGQGVPAGAVQAQAQPQVAGQQQGSPRLDDAWLKDVLEGNAATGSSAAQATGGRPAAGAPIGRPAAGAAGGSDANPI